MTTWRKIIRRGKDVPISDLENHTFTDTGAIDGDTVEELTFENTAATTFTNQSRNSTSFSNQSKNTTIFTNQSRN